MVEARVRALPGYTPAGDDDAGSEGARSGASMLRALGDVFDLWEDEGEVAAPAAPACADAEVRARPALAPRAARAPTRAHSCESPLLRACGLFTPESLRPSLAGGARGADAARAAGGAGLRGRPRPGQWRGRPGRRCR